MSRIIYYHKYEQQVEHLNQDFGLEGFGDGATQIKRASPATQWPVHAGALRTIR